MIKFRITQSFEGYRLYYKLDFGPTASGYVLYHEHGKYWMNSIEECHKKAEKFVYDIMNEKGALIEEFEL